MTTCFDANDNSDLRAAPYPDAAAIVPAMRADLIMDLGMHDGTDTAYYLAKGFTVVAVEANPALVASARKRFATEITQGRLTIVGAAIAETRGTTSMAIADTMTIWSSLDPAFINRNQGVNYRHIEVPTISFRELLAGHGVPYFLKIDIEGFDMLPIRGLRGVGDRPRYVSLESSVSSNEAGFDRVFDELAELWSLGYRAFKYVDQSILPRVRLPARQLEGCSVDGSFAGHSSGPFGRDTPGPWLTPRRALVTAELLRLGHNLGGYGGKWSNTRPGRAYAAARQTLLRRSHSWYDLHARLPE